MIGILLRDYLKYGLNTGHFGCCTLGVPFYPRKITHRNAWGSAPLEPIRRKPLFPPSELVILKV